MIKYFVLIALCLCMKINAQIGVNTETPRGVFHVDAKGNTVNDTPSMVLDDIVFTKEGKLGIGTIDPQAKLHIVTGGTSSAPIIGLRLVDGNEKEGKILFSDSEGNAHWDDLKVESVPEANVSIDYIDISSTEKDYYKTFSYIDLPPGRWLVELTGFWFPNALYKGDFSDRVWVTAFLTELDQEKLTRTDVSPDIEDGKVVSGLVLKTTYNVVSGSVIVHNSGLSTKRYYCAVGGFLQQGISLRDVTFHAPFSSLYSTNAIIAIRLKVE